MSWMSLAAAPPPAAVAIRFASVPSRQGRPKHVVRAAQKKSLPREPIGRDFARFTLAGQRALASCVRQYGACVRFILGSAHPVDEKEAKMALRLFKIETAPHFVFS
jgi:hypothetical protein